MPGGESKRKCGRYTRNRGYRFENETRIYFGEGGLNCYRVPYSGAGEEKGDICVKTGWDEVLYFELKRKKELPAWITGPLGKHTGLIMRADNGDALAVVRLSDLRDWLQCR
jgi:Holliday junction resolvase